MKLQKVKKRERAGVSVYMNVIIQYGLVALSLYLIVSKYRLPFGADERLGEWRTVSGFHTMGRFEVSFF